MGGNEDIDLLRAIAHARMYLTSGRGLESVVHRLAEANLGRASEILQPALNRMIEGEPTEMAIRSELDQVEDPHLRAFVSALIVSGKPGLMRLDELSTGLHMQREPKAEQYAARLTGVVDLTTTLFVLSFIPTMVRILGRIPPNAILPRVDPGPYFEWVFYSILAALLTGLLASARGK